MGRKSEPPADLTGVKHTIFRRRFSAGFIFSEGNRGARGPRPDPDQAAKGYPGRRPRKADKVAKEAARVAALVAAKPGAPVDVHPMLLDPKYAAAAEIWRRLAPELRRTHRLPLESEFHFVQVCIYAQEWVSATDDLHANGFTQTVETVAGGKMERRRPKTFDRQQAFQNLSELSRRFGLTPSDMYDLFKGQRLAAAENPGLFGEARQSAAEAEPEGPGRVGMMGRMRSEPPTERLN